MRYALPASALVHAGIFGIALVGFVWPKPDDAPAPGSIEVDIISLASVLSNETELVANASAESLISAGSETATIEPSETLEPVEPETQTAEAPIEEALPPETVEPLEKEQTPPLETAMAEPVETEPLEPLTETVEMVALATPIASLEPLDTIAPVATETVELEEVTDFNAPPVPHTLSFERPSAPTQRPRPPQQQPTQTASRQVSKPPPQGNGGQSNADSAASRASVGQQGQGSGGAGQIASWHNQVMRRLNNAKRRPRIDLDGTETVVVRFTVSASGGLAGVTLARSSGSPVLDQAAIDTVNRAAPFPPPPTGTSQTMDVPVDFKRR